MLRHTNLPKQITIPSVATNVSIAQNHVLDLLSKELLAMLASLPLEKKSKDDATKKLDAIVAKYRGEKSDREPQMDSQR